MRSCGVRVMAGVTEGLREDESARGRVVVKMRRDMIVVGARELALIGGWVLYTILTSCSVSQ